MIAYFATAELHRPFLFVLIVLFYARAAYKEHNLALCIKSTPKDRKLVYVAAGRHIGSTLILFLY